jgi:hypothetical protein
MVIFFADLSGPTSFLQFELYRFNHFFQFGIYAAHVCGKEKGNYRKFTAKTCESQ